MRFTNCAALAAVVFTILTQNLRLCSSAEAGLFLICSSILSQNEPRVFIKLFLQKVHSFPLPRNRQNTEMIQL